MSDLTAEQLRRLLLENERYLAADEKEIALMQSAGVQEPVLQVARSRLRANQETNATLRSLISEIE